MASSEFDRLRTRHLFQLYAIDWFLVLVLPFFAGGAFKLLEPRSGDSLQFELDNPSIAHAHRADELVSPGTLVVSLSCLSFGVLIFYHRRAKVFHRAYALVEVHHAIIALLQACVLQMLVVVSLKLAVGRLRPDFISRCQPRLLDEFFDEERVLLATLDQCTGDQKLVKDGRLSFPSGHTAFAFTAAVHLALFLTGKCFACDGLVSLAYDATVRSRRSSPHSLPPAWVTMGDWLSGVFLPLVLAALVGASRVFDHRHHLGDVWGGAVIGSVAALVCFRLHFEWPSPSRVVGEPIETREDGTLPDVPPVGEQPTTRMASTRNPPRRTHSPLVRKTSSRLALSFSKLDDEDLALVNRLSLVSSGSASLSSSSE